MTEGVGGPESPSEWRPDQSALDYAAAMTPVLRSSPNPQWSELRERLGSVGVVPDEAVLTEWVTEGGANMGATVATRDGRVFDVMIVMGWNRDAQQVDTDEGYATSFREVPTES